MFTCKGVFLPVLAGYLLSGIPDGQGIFLKKAICEGHRTQAQDCDVRCLPTGHLMGSAKHKPTQVRASSVYGRREACPGRV